MSEQELREQLNSRLKYRLKRNMDCPADTECCVNNCELCITNLVIKDINQWLEEQGAVVNVSDSFSAQDDQEYEPLRLEVK